MTTTMNEFSTNELVWVKEGKTEWPGLYIGDIRECRQNHPHPDDYDEDNDGKVQQQVKVKVEHHDNNNNNNKEVLVKYAITNIKAYVPYGNVRSMSTVETGPGGRTRRQRSAPKRYINDVEVKVERTSSSLSSKNKNKKPKVAVKIKPDPDNAAKTTTKKTVVKGTTKKSSSSSSSPRECVMCIAHGRKKMKCDFDDDQFIPILLKRRGCSTEKITVGYNHVCCAIRAEPQKILNEKEKPEWWMETSEITHGYPGLSESRFDSTSMTTAAKSNSNSTTTKNNENKNFVPYSMSFDDWMDEFCVYNYRMLLGSVRRFNDGRGPPYNIVGSTAALWRCDDRGSIGYARMVQDLTEQASATTLPAGKDRLTQAEAALWGAITYRIINRLSTFSRWAAIKKLSNDEGKSISELIDKGLYETAIHGDDNEGTNRNEDLHSIAASGVTLLGRMGYRDKWGKDFCIKQMESVSPMCCISQLPLPSELTDFKKFTNWEKLTMGRGVMTGEHQVQPYETIMSVLKNLAANNCSQLKKMSKVFMETDNAKVVLDGLKEL
jgi:hypothetical protein